ncbi:hypothetical protein [Candidatus Parabeggiatoa sp. HSG14]|uniref:hypothetical protein n=1 Tax=Candidatus Parabeggiatoa sp. HSG14 TaxID=3055593 RepID=UPI0025A90461|nr:hypothetical protein [Thiotrichales bacterium HSG14]
MKHKIRHLVALIGTALLGNHSIASANIENPSSENGYHNNNDSFVSKLTTATGYESIYRGDLTEDFSSFSDFSKGESQENHSSISDMSSTTTCSGGNTGSSGNGGGSDGSGSYGLTWFDLSTPENFVVEHYDTAHLRTEVLKPKS